MVLHVNGLSKSRSEVTPNGQKSRDRLQALQKATLVVFYALVDLIDRPRFQFLAL